MRDPRGRGEGRVGHLSVPDDPRATGAPTPRGGLDRRAFLRAGALAALALPFAGRLVRAADALPAATLSALESSSFVYVSPLRRDGRESTCHGEVWYGWLDGAVVLTTSHTSWKARSLARGDDRARLWVGSYGRWKGMLGTSDAFRAGPSFDARVSASKDAALFDRLMTVYEKKYASEFSGWRDRMRSGYASGDRVLLRYAPLGA